MSLALAIAATVAALATVAVAAVIACRLGWSRFRSWRSEFRDHIQTTCEFHGP